MNQGKVREDKTCQNCGYQVEDRFCSHCGQENTESRQPFYYLFTHFIEDFTHYDGQFWKTIKYLLFSPGKLTKEYTLGKRQLYVAPVKLYIFISFITFLIPAILPKSKSTTSKEEKIKFEQPFRNKKTASHNVSEGLQKENLRAEVAESPSTSSVRDSLHNREPEQKILEETFDKEQPVILNAHNMKEYDSLMLKDKSDLYKIGRPIAEKVFALQKEGFNKKQIWDRYKENFTRFIPKALFIYLPLFAFFLWLFHNKKKWWYFDHGVFTLHYFSFLLTVLLIVFLLTELASKMELPEGYNRIVIMIPISSFLISIIYFFVAQQRVYKTKNESFIFIRGVSLFIVNIIGILLMFIILLYISFVMMH